MSASLPKKVAFRREHTGDAHIDRAQRLAQATATAHEQTKTVLQACPFLIGKLVSVNFTIAGGTQIITHNLGVAAACIVVRQNYLVAALGGSITEDAGATGYDTANQQAMAATAICTVDLWFYPRASITAV